MSLKFEKNRGVPHGYAKIPLFYTGIKSPSNKNKELVIMDRIGKNYTAAWRNNKLSKIGIEFLIPVIEGGFLFKGKKVLLKNCKKVW